jgi:HNH endonuclease
MIVIHNGHPVDTVTGKIYGCEIATHVDPSGYRQVYVKKGKTIQAHRFLWEAIHGPIPPGLLINHLNGVKTDNRIENLELATPRENILHAYRTGLSSNKGMRHPTRKLNNIRVMAIRALAEHGMGHAEIALMSGVTRRQVNDIVRLVAWSHLPAFTTRSEDL